MHTITKTRYFRLSPETLYRFWTTKDGLNAFFSKDNHIKIQKDGPYEIYFDLDVNNQARGSEGCKVIEYMPNKMIHFTWNVPPMFDELRKSNARTHVKITFDVIDDSTKVVLTNSGYLNDPIWTEVYAYFDKAWDFVLDNLLNVTTKFQ